MKEIKRKEFANGVVYALETDDGYPIEVTDTFLPYYTKDAIGRKQNKLDNTELGSRKDRWMIGVSCMSGCPVKCAFCATGKLKRYRNLTAQEIVDQVMFVVSKHKNGVDLALSAKEFKINYTRMGEPFLNITNVKDAIDILEDTFTSKMHNYISTIGLQNADYGWLMKNDTLQISLHSLVPERRSKLIPYKNLMSIEDLGRLRTNSGLKTTLNLTLVDRKDFDIGVLSKCFDPKHFFIKLSPINKNEISEKNGLGDGYIKEANLL